MTDRIPTHLRRKPLPKGPSIIVHGASQRNNFYNTAQWINIRSMVLNDEPMCRLCGDAAKTVDHMNRLTRDNRRGNLCPLCNTCHSWKSGTFDKTAKLSFVKWYADYIELMPKVLRLPNRPALRQLEACCTVHDKFNILASIVYNSDIMPSIIPYQTILDDDANIRIDDIFRWTIIASTYMVVHIL